jgi:hypothetical protein
MYICTLRRDPQYEQIATSACNLQGQALRVKVADMINNTDVEALRVKVVYFLQDIYLWPSLERVSEVEMESDNEIAALGQAACRQRAAARRGGSRVEELAPAQAVRGERCGAAALAAGTS